MKKLTKRFKNWLLRRSKKRSRNFRRRTSTSRFFARNLVTAWFGDTVEEIICTGEPMHPPSTLCFEENPLETLKFFSDWRDKGAIRSNAKINKSYGWTLRPKQPGKMRRIRTYWDFSQIQKISTASALVLAAEYDRAARIMQSVPPTINLDQWNKNVFNKLFELGFFEIVGLTEDVRSRYRDVGDIRTMHIITGSNASDLQRASERLIELSRFIDEDSPMSDDVLIALNSALSEAMANVSRHAYPEDLEFDFQHVKAWWATASADRSQRKLTVVIYDQGASIPVTIPRKQTMRAVTDFVRRNLMPYEGFEFQDDATYIEGALRRGETQTGEKGRGEGLPQMKELVDICQAGSLSIWSRGGFCCYTPGYSLARTAHRVSVGGTLIEWVMELPRVQTNA